MHTLKLFYSVSNGGDGSAYPQFSLNEELVDIHQEMENDLRGEGWGEPCTGCIELESESPITISQSQLSITKASLLETVKYYLDGGYYKSETVKKSAEKFKEQIEKVIE